MAEALGMIETKGFVSLVEATDDGGIHWRMVLLPALTP